MSKYTLKRLAITDGDGVEAAIGADGARSRRRESRVMRRGRRRVGDGWLAGGENEANERERSKQQQ